MVRDRDYRRRWAVTALRMALFAVAFAVAVVVAEELMALSSPEGDWGMGPGYRLWTPFVGAAWVLVGGGLLDHYLCKSGQMLMALFHAIGIVITAALWSDHVTEPPRVTVGGPGFEGLDSMTFAVFVAPMFAAIAVGAVLVAGLVSGSFPALVPVGAVSGAPIGPSPATEALPYAEPSEGTEWGP